MKPFPFLRPLAWSAILLFAVAICQAAPPARSYYVSTAGSDANAGLSPAAPFATLSRARDAVRAVNAAMAGDIVVYIMPGDYLLPAPLTFTEKDSGTNGHFVIYRNYGATGSARLIGATRVHGWTRGQGNILRANIGPGLGFTTLYEDGIRADMARWPKRTSPFATSRAGYFTCLSNERAVLEVADYAPHADGPPFTGTGDFTKAWLYGWADGDGHRWSSATAPVASVSGTTIHLSNGSGLGGAPSSCLLENSRALLSVPGEYFYDKSSGELDYISRQAGPIERQDVLVPRVVRLLDVSGGSGSAVQNLQFIGLTFMGTDRVIPCSAMDWVDRQPALWEAAVYLRNASHITLQNCRVADTGINGVTLDAGSENCTLTGCLIEHTGYHGINIKSEGANLVSNCLIRYSGELQGHGSGISVMAGPQTMRNLEIYFAPRAGIAIRSHGCVLEYSRIHDTVQDSGDQGGIYLVDPAADTTCRQCMCYHNYVDLSCMDRPPTAVYNDRDAPGTVWSNIDAGDSQFYIFRHDPQPADSTMTFENVSWQMDFRPAANQATYLANPVFDKTKMEYSRIGVTRDFPPEFNDLAAAPPTPLNVWTQPGNGEATLHWTEADRATKYLVKRFNPATRTYLPIGASAVPATGWSVGTEYTDRGLANGAAYSYIVTAANQAGESAPSLPAMVTPSPRGAVKLAGKVLGTVPTPGAAVDGDLKTWTGSTGWVGLDLGSPKVVTGLRYSPRSDNTDTTSWMAGGQFQGANDPAFAHPVTIFTVLGTKGGAGVPVLIPVSIHCDQSFRYLRYIGLKNSTIAEMEFLGHAP